MFDLHVHSKNSHDSKQTLPEICESAIEKGIQGVAICDHADVWFFDKDGTENCIALCMQEINEARARYGDRLEIFKGIEMAEYLDDPERAERLLLAHPYDVVLGSVHSIRYEDITDAYSRIDFSEMPKEKILGFLRVYLEKMSSMVEKTDFDVLTHLTCPLRYINGKYERNIDMMYFKNEIGDILKEIIRKDIPLEINTSGIGSFYGEYMPDAAILRLYADLGGRYMALGSDAHASQYIGNAFGEAGALLRSLGLREYAVFRKRKMTVYPI